MSTNAAKELPQEEFILPGTRSCAACGLMLTYRYALKALDKGKAEFRDRRSGEMELKDLSGIVEAVLEGVKSW